MAKLLRIERAVQWIARTLSANRDANPNPEGVIDQILPVIDVFGSSRADQMQVASVSGALGNVEVFHSPVPAGQVRHYLSMEWSTDDAGRRIRPGRIIPTAAGFPFAGMADEQAINAGEFQAIRNFTVGPNSRAAVTADGLGLGNRIRLELVWVEVPLGEYLRSVE